MLHRPPQSARTNDMLEHSLLAAWLQASDIGLCVLDASNCVVMLNPAACRLLGIDGLQMLDQPMSTVFGALDDDNRLTDWLKAPSIEGECHISRGTTEGKVELLMRLTTLQALGGIPHHASTIEDDIDSAGDSWRSYKVIAISDVTELLAAQRKVDSEAYRRQWQALNAGVVISDAQRPDMPTVYVNPMFERISGYTAAEILGRNCRWLQGSDTDQPGLADIRQAIKNKTNGYARLRNYRKDGSMFINELFISPVTDDRGIVTHFVGIQHLQTDAGPGPVT